MTSSECMTSLVDSDVCNEMTQFNHECCHGFSASKLFLSGFLSVSQCCQMVVT